MPERRPCRLCGETILVGHEECPECGYNPQRMMTILSGVLFITGAALVPFVGDLAAGISLTGVVLFAWAAVWARPTR
ncbi:hypothetical protein [Halomontanus rarus]|uniref:hypothetical protein n=1 Tax=Halomontanus rarus TaxID=3034020 RepID=UPI0023E89434|nr:hypothetical protein [Halovivax sp. TS33]